MFNTLRLRQNERHFADDMFKWIFLNENVWIPIEISHKFVPKGSINNNPVLFQIMAWRRPGDNHYLNQWWLVHWRIYVSLGLNELNGIIPLTDQWRDYLILESWFPHFQMDKNNRHFKDFSRIESHVIMTFMVNFTMKKHWRYHICTVICPYNLSGNSNISQNWISDLHWTRKLTLVQVMIWCQQAASHWLSQCWPRSMSPYDVTRPQWIKYHHWCSKTFHP